MRKELALAASLKAICRSTVRIGVAQLAVQRSRCKGLEEPDKEGR